MGRTAKYTDQQILDAALELVAEDGPHAASAVAIAKRLGAPSGSIYHRFASRDLILATLWIRTVKRFQHGFLDALATGDMRLAADRAVAHTLAWTLAHRDEATVLTMYRREVLIALWPDELGDELASLNDSVTTAIMHFTQRRFGAVTKETAGITRFALVEIPYAAARQLLASARPLPWLEPAALLASAAALRTGDAER